MDYVTYELDGPVARITLNRPRYRNALSRRLLEELDTAFGDAAADTDVHVVVLFANGEHFCSGHDLGSPDEMADRELRPFPEDVTGRMEWMWSLNVENHRRWRALPKPTLAGVQGFCLYGGMMLLSVMDIVVASDDALFLPSFSQFFALPWEVSSHRLKELVFDDRFLEAEEAAKIGLVNRVVPRTQLEEATMAQAHRIAERDPFELRIAKASANAAIDAMGFWQAIEYAFGQYMLMLERELALPVDRNAGRQRPTVRAALEELRQRREQCAQEE